MINLNHLGNTASVIIHGLRQISEVTNPNFLFELYNKNSKVSILFITPDISLTPGLYSEFEFRSVASGATAGNFIGDVGEYLVTVRDTLYTNPTIASASSILVTDTCRIVGTSKPIIVSFTQSNTNTIVYYK